MPDIIDHSINLAADAMNNLNVNDVKPFVPARDFKESLRFYTGLGWTCKWQDESLAELELGGHRFYLQNYYNREWAENWMLFVAVEDVDSWHVHAKGVVEEFEGTRVTPPKTEEYGARVSYVWDPSGVLIHLAQFTAS